MSKILVLYYSQTGNTEKMAQAVVKGAQNNNTSVELSFHVNDAADLAAYDGIIFGTPTYRAQMPIDFKNLFEQVKAKNVNLKNKIGAVFGSYGWSGEAPQAVIDTLKGFGMQVIEPPIKCKLKPDQKVLEDCENLGKMIVDKLAGAK